MNWLLQMHESNAVAHAIGILSVVCFVGMALGSIKVRGIGLGTSGVLFAAIFVGYFAQPVDDATLEFVKESGLILFIFTIGLQLGPGFFASLRQQGLVLNALAATAVVLGALTASMLGWLLTIDPAAVLGLLSGATTNTPSLGAAQQTFTILPGVSADRQALPALAYAVSYPIGIAGIIGTLLALKAFFHIDPVKEAQAFTLEKRRDVESLERRTLIVGARVCIEYLPLGWSNAFIRHRVSADYGTAHPKRTDSRAAFLRIVDSACPARMGQLRWRSAATVYSELRRLAAAESGLGS